MSSQTADAVLLNDDDIKSWPGKEVIIQYKNRTNLQAKTLAKFIAAEAGEAYSRTSKDCEECSFISSGMSLLELQ